MPVPSLIKLEIGTFKGFSESGLEFTAEIVSPYHTEYRPNIGEFIVVALTHESAVLGRITRFFPMGVLSSAEGEEYLAEMRRRNRDVPEDLKETKLRYTVSVKLLGGLEVRGEAFVYHPALRQLPHLGARVGTLSDEALAFVCALGKGEGHSVPIGHYVVGEAVYDGSSERPNLPVMFDLDHLMGRRTYVFARAGYGKSNLIKLLIARLYELRQPGGMIIFDPEGEYAFRDKKGRPGLADVPNLADKLVVYTNRSVPKEYRRWVAGEVRLNLADLRPSDVVTLCVAEGKQEAVFANVLRGLEPTQWRALVKLQEEKGYRSEEGRIAEVTQYGDSEKKGVVIGAIKNNLTPVIQSLHSSQSTLVRSLRGHLSKGRIVVVDISLLSTTNGYRVAGLLLNELFRRNQESFVAGSEGDVIPIIAVLEEAQAVLPKGVSDSSPFAAWVKEGRKYQLGAILVTQQPGSIAPELLSQGDNFFAFHLLSVGDLKSLQSHNAHYSDDVLASILNEPIKGNAYMWSAPDQPFVLPCRVANFETWADGLPKDRRSPDFRTPAEEEQSAQLKRRERLKAIVQQVVFCDQRVPLHTVKEVSSQPSCGELAVSKWNLLLQVGGVIAEDDDLKGEFGSTFPDGKPLAREEAVVDCLIELGCMVGRADGSDGKAYYVLDGGQVLAAGKKPKDTQLALTNMVALA